MEIEVYSGIYEIDGVSRPLSNGLDVEAKLDRVLGAYEAGE
jgi:hypothetical protein